MKRTNESELVGNDKKQKNVINDHDYYKILKLMSRLSNIVIDCAVPEREQYISVFNEFKEAIPGLVVWGSQSTGKTSLLRRMFSVMSQKISKDLATRCPIELKKSIFYTENKVYFVDSNGKEGTFNSTKDDNYITNTIMTIENYMHTHPESHLNGKIVVEMESASDNLIVIDLPGCVRDNPEYFSKLKNTYLKKTGNIIIYVARGDIDPSSDMSLDYLKDVTNDKICVLTHTDFWKFDSEKIYLEKYKSIFNNIFLVNNKENELEILDGYNNVKIGTQSLLDEMNKTIKQKIFDSLSIFGAKIDILEKKTKNELASTGEYTVNKTYILTQFQSQLNYSMYNTFKTFNYNKNNNDIYLREIQKCFMKIPQPDELVTKIRNINNPLGWETLFEIYSDDMKSSAFIYLSKIIDNYFGNILTKLLAINYDYKSRTHSIEIIIKEKMKSMIEYVKEKTKSSLKESIDKIILDNTDKGYLVSYQKEINNRCSHNFGLFKTDIEIQYTAELLDAKEHRIRLNHIWNHKCIKIIEIFPGPIDTYKTILNNDILKMINDITINDIDDESADIILYRNTLIKIEEICPKLRRKIHNYSSDGINELLNNYS